MLKRVLSMLNSLKARNLTTCQAQRTQVNKKPVYLKTDVPITLLSANDGEIRATNEFIPRDSIISWPPIHEIHKFRIFARVRIL